MDLDLLGIESLQTTPGVTSFFGTLRRETRVFFPLRVKNPEVPVRLLRWCRCTLSKTLHNLLHICLQIWPFDAKMGTGT